MFVCEKGVLCSALAPLPFGRSGVELGLFVHKKKGEREGERRIESERERQRQR